MRSTCALLTLVVTATFAVADNQSQPNTLTPEEIHAGWVLLFDGATTFGWKAGQESGWKVKEGTLQSTAASPVALVTTAEFGNYQLEFEYHGPKGGQGQFLVASGDREVKPVPSADQTGLPEGVYPLRVYGQDWHQVKIAVKRGLIASCLIRHQGASSSYSSVGTNQDQVKRGRIAFAGTGLVLRNIKLRPLNTVILFNGMDLTGWKIFPGKKSKFTVENGAITVLDGPGDLQTEGKYGDFLLQLECKSNGKHLNSGVFFRCRTGEYQNGYEAQVRNQFTTEPKQSYTIEDYDPKTHKLLNKKKVKYQAVDYGTGAIYRRQPARQGVAKDHAWFTMTILAHGHHFATWVNGIQVTDWTDQRPSSDNARTGCRLEAGHISLQGHDPTTNLSFRNFRIAELSK